MTVSIIICQADRKLPEYRKACRCVVMIGHMGVEALNLGVLPTSNSNEM